MPKPKFNLRPKIKFKNIAEQMKDYYCTVANFESYNEEFNLEKDFCLF